MSHSGEKVAYESVERHESRAIAGVRFTIRRASFSRRAELMRQVRELGRRLEFHQAGEGIADRIEANLLANEVEQMYLRWALVSVEGIEIDGETPTAETLIERGPEALAREISTAVQREIGLTDDERKN